MTCNDCLYYEVCPLGLDIKGKTGTCLKFKNKADFVEVVRCKDCRYFTEGMAVGMCKRVEDKPIIPCCFDHFCSYGIRKGDE